MSRTGRSRRFLLPFALASLLIGCASLPEGQPTSVADAWRGRLALRLLESPGQTRAESFSASFDLQGSPERGELTLYTPIGTTAGQVEWAPGQASLQTPSQSRRFDSLQALLEALLGTDVPVPALFAWLHGQPMSAAGWQVDLGQKSQGKIVATRLQSPKARLLIQLEH